MARRPHLPSGVLLGVVLATAVACSSSDGGETAPDAAVPPLSAPAGAEGATEPVPGLPGDEALTPPPPDSSAAAHLAQLTSVPQGGMVGHLALSVSGLAAFDEDVTGSCGREEGEPVFEAVLSDGSSWRISFGASGATSTLAAPGIEVEQQLREVDVSVSDRVVVGARLLTAGTSEASGRIDVELTCA